ncbi:hypothetical protein HYV80_04870 [Candidatus Woesearchaeota archaeon]|nr:hypothetical protein [Candidatus Woesearchaeota archaeon]
MLFFKPKPKIIEEFLPPPPPPEFDDFHQKPELFDETMQPKNAKQIPEEKEFGSFMKRLGKKAGQQASSKKKSTPKPGIPKKIAQRQLKNAAKAKSKKPLQKKSAKALAQKAKKPLQLKKLKSRKAPQLKPSKPAQEMPEEFELAPAAEMPESGSLMPEEFEFPELGYGKNIQPEAKPKEILEAEEEIKSAIENIKYHEERPSLFKRFLAKKSEPEKIPAIQNKDDVSAIKDGIAAARESLMKFDLDAAKRSYIEIMRVYNRIGPEAQAKVYNEVKDIYFERKSAEDLKA